MNEKLRAANRKTVQHDRIAICPIYGCEMKKKLKPLKFGLFGFSKHPRCSQHQRSLVYADELVEEFFSACTSCLFDRSALPPSSLLEQLELKDSEYIPHFIDAWIYCSGTGRNGRVISNYVDGLSRGYMSLLSRKEKKAVDRRDPKKRHQMLVSGIQKIISDYAKFLNDLGEKTDELLPSPELVPYSPIIKHAIKHWIDAQLLGLKTSKPTSIIAEKKELFDGVLCIGTALNLLGKSNDMLNKMISPHELFSGYREFSRAGLTRELSRRDIINLKARHDPKGKNDEEQEGYSIREEEHAITEEERDNNVIEKEHFLEIEHHPNKVNLEKKTKNYINIIKIRIRDGRILQFPNIIRHILSKAIYFLIKSRLYLTKEQIVESLILTIKDKDSSQEVIRELMQNNLLSYLHNKFQDPNVEEILRKYFIDLTEITKRLTAVKKSEILNITDFCRNLVKDGFNLFYSVDSLKRIIKNLVEYLTENVEDFNIQKKKAERVFDDGIYRECSKCHKRKVYKEFSKNKENNLHAICKECTNNIFAIKHSIKKLEVIENIYNGRYKSGKCVKCGNDIIKLPCFTFHHPDPSIKRFTWNIISSYDFNTIIRILEKEKVEIVCFNCQKLIHANVFNRFKKIILDPKLYNYKMKEIETRISEFRKKYNLKGDTNSIKNWIKKRIIIDYLYNGRCAGCGKMTILNELPCLEFHHIDPNPTDKKLRWKKVHHLNIKEIINKLLEERCICLCKNCHELIQAPLSFKHAEKILGKSKGQLAKNEYNTLITNIQKFNIVKNKRLYPVLIEFSLDKAWKRALLCVYKITKMKNVNEYTNKELSNCLNDSQAKRFSQKLISMNLISLLRYNKSREKFYSLTKMGIDTIDKLTSF